MTEQPTRWTPEEIQEDKVASAYCWALNDVEQVHAVLRTGLPHRADGVEALRAAAASLNHYLAELERAAS